MKKDTVTISVDAEKLRAARWHMTKRQVDLEAELTGYFQRLYEKNVPSSVREYIDENGEDTSQSTAPIPKQK